MSDKPVKVKRFYKTAGVEKDGERHAIMLDGKKARTRGRHPLSAPTEQLANAVAGEWRAQGDHLDPRTMKLTALLTAAIDNAHDRTAWVEDVLNYLGSDLVCYRADTPQKLVQRQAEVWDPFLDWLRNDLGAALVTTTGIMSVGQPDAALAPVRTALEKASAETLLGLKTATAITGSTVLALALWKDAFSADEIFLASRLDERFQEEMWGIDAEAKAREETIHEEFLAVAKFLRLL